MLFKYANRNLQINYGLICIHFQNKSGSKFFFDFVEDFEFLFLALHESDHFHHVFRNELKWFI